MLPMWAQPAIDLILASVILAVHHRLFIMDTPRFNGKYTKEITNANYRN
jgi:hypothetical protein